MLREVDFYFGIVISRLLREGGEQHSISALPDLSTSAFAIDGTAALFIKYCTKRLSPWSFTFTEEQIVQINYARTAELVPVIALVCQEDGIVTLSYAELEQLLGNGLKGGWVSAQRSKRQSYLVRGSVGVLSTKVSNSDFTRKIRDALITELPQNAVVA